MKTTADGVFTPTLAHDRVTLRAPRPGDDRLRQQHGWHASIERNYGHEREDGPMSNDEASEWLAWVTAESKDPQRRVWVIEVENALAGFTQLHGINEADRRARFAIGMFSPTFVGQGLGAEATRLVLRFAFETMGLHRVGLRVLEFNETARRAYERSGFVVEGRERETCVIAGRWHDDIVMGVLAEEFTSRQE